MCPHSLSPHVNITLNFPPSKETRHHPYEYNDHHLYCKRTPKLSNATMEKEDTHSDINTVKHNF
jgi:hypothetical protein